MDQHAVGGQATEPIQFVQLGGRHLARASLDDPPGRRHRRGGGRRAGRTGSARLPGLQQRADPRRGH
ncbi:hypothetical protein XarCFBP6762_21480, partial [Xanthomonas arboricola]